jgi:hypothetical protein
MQLEIRGKSKKLSHKATEKRVRVFAAQLMSPKMVASLSIRVIFKDLGENTGICWCSDRSARWPKKYFIHINNTISKDDQEAALAHELTHVKQWATGEKVDHVNGKTIRYRGEIFIPKADDSDYYKRPWEIEAYGYQVCLPRIYHESP